MKTATSSGPHAALTRRNFIAGGALAAGTAAAAGALVRDARAAEGEVTEAADAAETLAQIKPAMGHVVHNPALCSGCRTCEVVCSVAHWGVASSELSRLQWTKDVMDACITDIQACKQCNGPECLAACPTGALHVDLETGARVIDQDVCVGCQSCLNACPATPSRVRYCLDTNTCFKCDLCGGDPQCVKFCPTGALTATWMDISTESEEDKFFQVDLTGEARTFAHVETNTLELTEQTGGFTLDGVLWTSHATQFNIILALFDVTADFYGADGQLLGSTDNAAHIEIPEMQSAEFSLSWTTDLTLADIDHVVVNVPGEYQTNAPGQEG